MVTHPPPNTPQKAQKSMISQILPALKIQDLFLLRSAKRCRHAAQGNKAWNNEEQLGQRGTTRTKRNNLDMEEQSDTEEQLGQRRTTEVTFAADAPSFADLCGRRPLNLPPPTTADNQRLVSRSTKHSDKELIG